MKRRLVIAMERLPCSALAGVAMGDLIRVDIYEKHTEESPTGAPCSASDQLGSFMSDDIMFGTDTAREWHPFAQSK